MSDLAGGRCEFINVGNGRVDLMRARTPEQARDDLAKARRQLETLKSDAGAHAHDGTSRQVRRRVARNGLRDAGVISAIDDARREVRFREKVLAILEGRDWRTPAEAQQDAKDRPWRFRTGELRAG